MRSRIRLARGMPTQPTRPSTAIRNMAPRWPLPLHHHRDSSINSRPSRSRALHRSSTSPRLNSGRELLIRSQGKPTFHLVPAAALPPSTIPATTHHAFGTSLHVLSAFILTERPTTVIRSRFPIRPDVEFVDDAGTSVPRTETDDLANHAQGTTPRPAGGTTGHRTGDRRASPLGHGSGTKRECEPQDHREHHSPAEEWNGIPGSSQSSPSPESGGSAVEGQYRRKCVDQFATRFECHLAKVPSCYTSLALLPVFSARSPYR